MHSISPICYLGNPEHLSVPWLKAFCNFGSQNGAIETCLRPGLNANQKNKWLLSQLFPQGKPEKQKSSSMRQKSRLSLAEINPLLDYFEANIADFDKDR